jgi:flavin-binding protein dodecin
MSIVKVIEVLAESNKSWEDAAQDAVNQASKTIKNIKTVYVKEMQAIVENEKIVNYRINVKISFVVE